MSTGVISSICEVLQRYDLFQTILKCGSETVYSLHTQGGKIVR